MYRQAERHADHSTEPKKRERKTDWLTNKQLDRRI